MIRTITAVLAATLVLAACGPADKASETAAAGDPAASVGEINLYSSRHYDTDLALYAEFTEATGIKVNLIEADADALIERIKNEGDMTPADVLITVDAGRLWRAEQAGILENVDSAILNDRIPAHLRHVDGQWFGVSKRARVIIFNKAAGKPAPLDSYADLANTAHRGRVCIRSSANIYNISLMASLVSRLGAERAEAWARGVAANFARPPQGNDTAQIMAVASGECGIALVNTYYIARLKASNDPADTDIADRIGIVFPDQNGHGTHINISGAGLVKDAPHRDNAIKFLEYLTENRAQKYLADGNNEYPVIEGVAPSAAVTALGEFREDALDAAELGRHQAEAVRVFDRAGWQ